LSAEVANELQCDVEVRSRGSYIIDLLIGARQLCAWRAERSRPRWGCLAAVLGLPQILNRTREVRQPPLDPARDARMPLSLATRCNFQPPAEAGGRRQVSRSAPQAPGNKAIIKDGERETILSVWATDAGHVVRGVHRRHGRSALGLLRLPISGHAAVCVARPVRGRRNSRVVPAGVGRAERWCVRIGLDTAEKGRAARAFARSRKSDQVCVPNCLLTFGCCGARTGADQQGSEGCHLADQLEYENPKLYRVPIGLDTLETPPSARLPRAP
jgi:hypothetical protein